MNSILFLLRSLSLGGAERQLCTLARGLQQSGYSVKIAVFYAGGPLEAEARRNGIQILDLKRNGRWDYFLFFFRLLSLIRQEKPDILHSYLQVPNIWSAFVKLALPRTKVVWGIRASIVDMKQYSWQWALTDKAESLLAKIPDWIICNSRAGLQHHVERGYPADRMSVIHNGINTDSYFSDRKLGLGLRKQWGVQENQKLIGMIARLDPIKDIPNFLRAVSLLIKEREDVRVVYVGGGPENTVREYREISDSLNLQKHLIWAGEHLDMLSVYNALDILVLSSKSEGFSNVIGEAMACGVPCVATAAGDSAQLIGSFGEVVPIGDSEALKEAILVLLNRIGKERTSLSREVRQRMIDQFSVEKLVSMTVDTLNEVFMSASMSKQESLGRNLRL